MVYLTALLVTLGIVSFFTIASGIYLLVLVSDNESGTAATFGNVCGAITLITGIVFAILSWYGFHKQKYLAPYIKRLVSRTTGEVSEAKLDYHVTEAGKETDRQDVAHGIRNIARTGEDYNTRTNYSTSVRASARAAPTETKSYVRMGSTTTGNNNLTRTTINNNNNNSTYDSFL